MSGAVSTRMKSKSIYYNVLPLLLGILGLIFMLRLWIPVGLVDIEFDALSAMPLLNEIENITTIIPKSSYLIGSNVYQFGRFRTPIENMNLHPLTFQQRLAQKKEFVWTSASSANYLVGCAIVQFGYSTAVIMYTFDSAKNESSSLQLEVPLGSFFSWGAKFTEGSSPISGCASWDASGVSISKCYSQKSKTFDVSLAGKFSNGKRFRISYEMNNPNSEAMTMIFPIGPKRPSVVTKYAGVPSIANIQIDDTVIVSSSNTATTATCSSSADLTCTQQQQQQSNYLGMTDYTRGLLRRLTVWHWLAVSWQSCDSDSHSHGVINWGLQLSEGVYDNANNVSMESTIWRNGIAEHVNSPVVFTQLDKSVKPQFSKWTVATSSDKFTLNLEFTPADVIVGSFHYVVVDGDLYHMWGTYSGSLTFNGKTTALNSAPGVLEDHYALW